MSPDRPIRCLLVEDEPVAARALRRMVDEVPWLEAVGQAADGREALAAIERLRPELVFLDVEMPELDGLGVLARLEERPAVVFTTAYDRYAVAAFEHEAVDYLVKPFGRRRFLATAERVRRRLRQAAPPAAGGEPEAAAKPPAERLFARRGDRIVPLPVAEVRRLQAAGDYAEVHTAAGTYLLDTSLTALAGRLDPQRFVRIHRSHLVNLDHVSALRPFDDRRLEVVLTDGTRVVASRAGSRRLRALAR